jgi:hypothetical protein
MGARPSGFILSNEQRALVHFAAIQALLHTQKHGNSSPNLQLAELLSFALKINYAKWLRLFSPIRLTKSGSKLAIKLQKPTDPDYHPFAISNARAAPFLEITNLDEILSSIEQRFENVGIGKIIQILSTLLNPEKQNITKQISVLPFLSFSQLFERYRVCVERLTFSFGSEPKETIKLKNAIFAEWARRRVESQSDEYFVWPTTAAPLGNGKITGFNSPADGMLAAFGYHVGKTSSCSDLMRQIILDDIFSIHLPPLDSEEYMQQWGAPGSAARLKKLAHTLASLAKNEKRRGLVAAPQEREMDLDYLHSQYYVKKFGFGWPRT